MASIQYLIDSICSSLTVESLYKLVEIEISKGSLGAFKVDDLIPGIQGADRSLDRESALALAQATVEDLAGRGRLRAESGCFYPVK